MTPAPAYRLTLTCPDCGGLLHGDRTDGGGATRLAATVECEDCGAAHTLIVSLRPARTD